MQPGGITQPVASPIQVQCIYLALYKEEEEEEEEWEICKKGVGVRRGGGAAQT